MDRHTFRITATFTKKGSKKEYTSVSGEFQADNEDAAKSNYRAHLKTSTPDIDKVLSISAEDLTPVEDRKGRTAKANPVTTNDNLENKTEEREKAEGGRGGRRGRGAPRTHEA